MHKNGIRKKSRLDQFLVTSWSQKKNLKPSAPWRMTPMMTWLPMASGLRRSRWIPLWWQPPVRASSSFSQERPFHTDVFQWQILSVTFTRNLKKMGSVGFPMNDANDRIRTTSQVWMYTMMFLTQVMGFCCAAQVLGFCSGPLPTTDWNTSRIILKKSVSGSSLSAGSLLGCWPTREWVTVKHDWLGHGMVTYIGNMSIGTFSALWSTVGIERSFFTMPWAALGPT